MEMWKVRYSVEVEAGCHGDVGGKVFCKGVGTL